MRAEKHETDSKMASCYWSGQIARDHGHADIKNHLTLRNRLGTINLHTLLNCLKEQTRSFP